MGKTKAAKNSLCGRYTTFDIFGLYSEGCGLYLMAL
jgi:hypothetical protein